MQATASEIRPSVTQRCSSSQRGKSDLITTFSRRKIGLLPPQRIRCQLWAHLIQVWTPSVHSSASTFVTLVASGSGRQGPMNKESHQRRAWGTVRWPAHQLHRGRLVSGTAATRVHTVCLLLMFPVSGAKSSKPFHRSVAFGFLVRSRQFSPAQCGMRGWRELETGTRCRKRGALRRCIASEVDRERGCQACPQTPPSRLTIKVCPPYRLIILVYRRCLSSASISQLICTREKTARQNQRSWPEHVLCWPASCSFLR